MRASFMLTTCPTSLQGQGCSRMPHLAPALVTTKPAFVAGEPERVSREHVGAQHSWPTEESPCSIVLGVQAARMDCIRFDQAWARGVQDKLQLVLPLQRWLRHHGNWLLQMQCDSNFDDWVRT